MTASSAHRVEYHHAIRAGPSTPTRTVGLHLHRRWLLGPPGSCSLVATGSARSACLVTFTPSVAGADTITSDYSGANSYGAGTGAASFTGVAPPSASVPPAARPSNACALSRLELDERRGTRDQRGDGHRESHIHANRRRSEHEVDADHA
jgi:hypothetical protein